MKIAEMDNAAIAELLSRESETASYPLKRALRKAGRVAFLWPEEADDLVRQGRSLTELSDIGPYLEKLIMGWLSHPPLLDQAPNIRDGFLTLPKARRILARHPFGEARLFGDLQMHTEWSDGSGTILSMAQSAR